MSNQATQNIKVQATRQLDDNYQIEAYYGNVEVKRITPTPTNIKIEVKKQSALVLKINYSF